MFQAALAKVKGTQDFAKPSLQPNAIGGAFFRCSSSSPFLELDDGGTTRKSGSVWIWLGLSAFSAGFGGSKC